MKLVKIDSGTCLFCRCMRMSLLALIILLCIPGQGNAQFVYFGRNKVQFNNFEWKILKTEHFDIYYYDSLFSIASIGANIAEEAFTEYQIKFNHYIAHKIPLIFYNTHNHFEQTNITPGFIPEGVGGFFEFVKGRVVIPYLGSLGQFRHVIRHELTHVFMTTKILRTMKEHRIPAERFPPLWFTEGLAEYMSTEWDEQSNMALKDAVLSGYFRNLRAIEEISGSYLMYKEGQAFLEFVAHVYGPEKVQMLIEDFWMYERFTKLVEYVLGEKLEKIDERWEYFLRQKYFPLYQRFAPFTQNAKKLPPTGYSFSPVHYSDANEDAIYFVANADGYASIYKTKKDTVEGEFLPPELVLRGEKSEDLEAFHLLQPAMSVTKNGILAFVTKSGEHDLIHFYDIRSGEEIGNFGTSFLISISSPAFSPDGGQVAFSAIDTRGYTDLFILNWQDGVLRRLTDDYYDDKEPCFSADGKELYFSSDRTTGKYAGRYNIFSMSLLTGHITYKTYTGYNCISPKAFNDKIYFVAEKDSIKNIFYTDSFPDRLSTAYYQVTKFLGGVYHPCFHGNKIYFSGFENAGFKLYEFDLSSYSPDTLPMRIGYPSKQWAAGFYNASAEKGVVAYEKEYTLDYMQSQIITDPIFGTRGGGTLLLSDLFGNEYYSFLIYNTAEVQSDFLKSFNVALSKYSLERRTNYGFGIFNFSGRRYDIRDSDEFYWERSYGGYFALYFPISKFDRIEAEITVANSDKEVIANVLERSALLCSNTISYTHDNTLWAYTGPIDGNRFVFLLGYTSDVKYSNVNYYSLIADYRTYLRLALRSTLALRTSVYYNDGKEARRYFAGGSWDLRGWDRFSIRGEKMWLSSLELRVPLIDQIKLATPVIDMGFYGIRAALFFDAGSAWDRNYETTYGSVGAGMRLNLFNIIVFRYDIGKKIEQNFGSFQPHLFYQFFFGWDF